MEFDYIDRINLRCLEQRLNRYKAKAKVKRQKLYKSHPEEQKRRESINRGLGFNPINNYFKGSTHHHLHLEGNNEFIIFIPTWLHRMYNHNATNRRGMDTINAIALDFFINEEFYNSLHLGEC